MLSVDELRFRMMEQRPEWAPMAQGICPHCYPLITHVPSIMAEDKPENIFTHGLSEAITSLAHAIRELAKSNNVQLDTRLGRIEEKVKLMAATQSELAADLRVVIQQQKKTQTEIQSVQSATDILKAKVKELEDIIANNPEAAAIPELVQAVADVKAQAQVVDNEIPDLVAERPR